MSLLGLENLLWFSLERLGNQELVREPAWFSPLETAELTLGKQAAPDPPAKGQKW